MSDVKAEYSVDLKSAIRDKLSNEIYLKKLSVVKKETVFPIIQIIHAEEFKNIDCLLCANCCKTTHPLITQQDVNRISRHLKISGKQFIRNYVLKDYNGEMMFRAVPCTFLGSENICSIYNVRPEACRRYPHTDEMEYPKRISLNLSNTLVCPAAYKILDRLKKAIPLSL